MILLFGWFYGIFVYLIPNAYFCLFDTLTRLPRLGKRVQASSLYKRLDAIYMLASALLCSGQASMVDVEVVSAIALMIFVVFLAVGTVLLANPLRHFEIYLGQWSMSGPGRAFRIIPIFDGIGWAICINAIVRAINCAVIAAIAILYVSHSIKDDTLPFTYCRDFEFNSYAPIQKDIIQGFSPLMLNYTNNTYHEIFYDKNGRKLVKTRVGNIFHDYYRRLGPTFKVSTSNLAWTWNASNYKIDTCNETFNGYPKVYKTPAYNFFYIEVMRLSSEFSYLKINIPLVICMIIIWTIIWGVMVLERIVNKRLIYNNIQIWIISIPWAWTLLLLVVCIGNLVHVQRFPDFRIGGKEVLYGLSNGFEAALYIHSAGVGTEIVLGKGLNYFSTTHIDAKVNDENVWHSSLLLLLSLLQTGGVTACALLDCVNEHNHGTFDMHEGIIWVLPMYSKCATLVNYSHTVTSLLFGGLAITYTVSAYVLIKTALHVIFEYKVKLVAYEQLIVGVFICGCVAISMLYATNIGVALLESVDATMTGVTTPVVCLMELVGLLYIYRSTDFVSDMNVATEENNCGYRIGFQWKTIPLITLIVIIIKIMALLEADIPALFMSVAALPLLLVLLAVPLRAVHNTVKFLRAHREIVEK